jgi:hypothetical protein
MRVRFLDDATRKFPYLRDAIDASRALVPSYPRALPLPRPSELRLFKAFYCMILGCAKPKAGQLRPKAAALLPR